MCYSILGGGGACRGTYCECYVEHTTPPRACYHLDRVIRHRCPPPPPHYHFSRLASRVSLRRLIEVGADLLDACSTPSPPLLWRGGGLYVMRLLCRGFEEVLREGGRASLTNYSLHLKYCTLVGMALCRSGSWCYNFRLWWVKRIFFKCRGSIRWFNLALDKLVLSIYIYIYMNPNWSRIPCIWLIIYNSRI